MAHYINADTLRDRIKKNKYVIEPMFLKGDDSYYEGEDDGYNRVLSIIDSLQQEQPEVDLVAELKHHLATTPKEQLEKEWKELEPWSNIGPTVQEFLYGKQPEVDLKEEIAAFFSKNPIPHEHITDWPLLKNTALHFFNLGLNARKV